jgi:hypothetical protein
VKTWPIPGKHEPVPGDRDHLAFLAHWLNYVARGYFYRNAGPGRAVYFYNGVTAAFLIPPAHQDVLWAFINAGYASADGNTTSLRLSGSEQDSVRVAPLEMTCCGRQLWVAASTLEGS